MLRLRIRTSCVAFRGLDQPLLNGNGSTAQHIAAIGRCIDSTLGHHDPNEQIVDIGIRVQGGADDRDLACLGAATADAVNLQLVARAHQVEQQLITLLDRIREVPGEKYRPLDVPPRISTQGIRCMKTNSY